MINTWFDRELPEDDYDTFYPENVEPENMAQVIDWFLRRVEYIVEMDDIDSLYVSGDMTELIIVKNIRDRGGRFDHTETYKVPAHIIFSNSNIHDWIKVEKQRRKEAEEAKRAAKKKADEKKYRQERFRDYVELKKEFEDG